MSFVEIHFHLLAGVDDGPTGVPDSLSLASAAVSDGTRTVVATPHVHAQHVVDPGVIQDVVAEFVRSLRGAAIPLEVLPGGELAHDMVDRLTNQQLEVIAHGPPGRRWVLLEAPFDGLDDRFTASAEALRERGFAVTVAHPERVAQLAAGEATLAHELAVESVLQLTAASFLGVQGEAVRALAFRLLRATPRVVIASDAHGKARMPSLRLALDQLAAAGERDPARYVSSIPRALLEHGIHARPQAQAA